MSLVNSRLRPGSLLLCVVVLAFPAASYPSGPSPPARAIPSRILESGQRYLIERVGKGFFEKYITIDSGGCNFWPGDVAANRMSGRSAADGEDTLAPALVLPPRLGGNTPRWMLAYKLEMPSKPWVEGNISFEVDSAGAWVGDLGFYGISDCINHPEECTFSVKQESAVRTAKRAKFEAGLKEWTAEFQWQAVAQPSSYAWIISNTLSLSRDGCSGSGQSMIVDASTGKILTTTNWSRICDFISSGVKPPAGNESPGAPVPVEDLPAENEFVYYEEAPVPVVHEQPKYPGLVQGLVILHLLVSTDGRVRSVKVIHGVTELNEAAMEAAKKWIFKPARSNNKPVAVWIEVPFRFPP